MAKTKDIYSAYCPTGGRTHHPPFCLSLSTARLLYSYVCPCTVSAYFAVTERGKLTQMAGKVCKITIAF